MGGEGVAALVRFPMLASKSPEMIAERNRANLKGPTNVDQS